MRPTEKQIEVELMMTQDHEFNMWASTNGEKTMKPKPKSANQQEYDRGYFDGYYGHMVGWYSAGYANGQSDRIAGNGYIKEKVRKRTEQEQVVDREIDRRLGK